MSLLQGYTSGMDKPKGRGRPRKSSEEAKDAYLDLRLESAEKQAFKDAAALAGIPLSTWVRERLRRIARQELQDGNQPVAFMAAK